MKLTSLSSSYDSSLFHNLSSSAFDDLIPTCISFFIFSQLTFSSTHSSYLLARSLARLSLKMVSLALHRYLASIAKDARYYSAVRTGDNEPSSIVIEDLLLSLQENACVVERPPYFVDGPT